MQSVASISPLSAMDPIVEPKAGTALPNLRNFHRQAYNSLRTWTAQAQDETAAIATSILVLTRLPTPSGLFRISTYLRITYAAGASSSAQITIGWTDGGVACSDTFSAVTGNTTATTQSGSRLVQADRDTTITYAVAYASSPAAAMSYSLSVRAEALPVGTDVSA